ncbi:hypothetical protein GMRT_15603 [Giardia muris]|uniref:Uncharacterized protein n=1 Tax=Giardia muris TaxID=5742 RepID=A0A4Z1SSD0_GIAMU|nr:hypothetical protein GMRT_15603 [Giardia muris]|eukprot:TNJ28806.1 hypothetical protein GMRT_15603 [Giardia muris]
MYAAVLPRDESSIGLQKVYWNGPLQTGGDEIEKFLGANDLRGALTHSCGIQSLDAEVGALTEYLLTDKGMGAMLRSMLHLPISIKPGMSASSASSLIYFTREDEELLADTFSTLQQKTRVLGVWAQSLTFGKLLNAWFLALPRAPRDEFTCWCLRLLLRSIIYATDRRANIIQTLNALSDRALRVWLSHADNGALMEALEAVLVTCGSMTHIPGSAVSIFFTRFHITETIVSMLTLSQDVNIACLGSLVRLTTELASLVLEEKTVLFADELFALCPKLARFLFIDTLTLVAGHVHYSLFRDIGDCFVRILLLLHIKHLTSVNLIMVPESLERGDFATNEVRKALALVPSCDPDRHSLEELDLPYTRILEEVEACFGETNRKFIDYVTGIHMEYVQGYYQAPQDDSSSNSMGRGESQWHCIASASENNLTHEELSGNAQHTSDLQPAPLQSFASNLRTLSSQKPRRRPRGSSDQKGLEHIKPIWSHKNMSMSFSVDIVQSPYSREVFERTCRFYEEKSPRPLPLLFLFRLEIIARIFSIPGDLCIWLAGKDTSFTPRNVYNALYQSDQLAGYEYTASLPASGHVTCSRPEHIPLSRLTIMDSETNGSITSGTRIPHSITYFCTRILLTPRFWEMLDQFTPVYRDSSYLNFLVFRLHMMSLELMPLYPEISPALLGILRASNSSVYAALAMMSKRTFRHSSFPAFVRAFIFAWLRRCADVHDEDYFRSRYSKIERLATRLGILTEQEMSTLPPPTPAIRSSNAKAQKLFSTHDMDFVVRSSVWDQSASTLQTSSVFIPSQPASKKGITSPKPRAKGRGLGLSLTVPTDSVVTFETSTIAQPKALIIPRTIQKLREYYDAQLTKAKNLLFQTLSASGECQMLNDVYLCGPQMPTAFSDNFEAFQEKVRRRNDYLAANNKAAYLKSVTNAMRKSSTARRWTQPSRPPRSAQSRARLSAEGVPVQNVSGFDVLGTRSRPSFGSVETGLTSSSTSSLVEMRIGQDESSGDVFKVICDETL